MSDLATQSVSEIPNHVPAELVIPWDYEKVPGATEDLHKANSVVFDGPDIFFSPTTYACGQFGAWVITRNALIREACQDPETFANQNQTGWSMLIGEPWKLIPLELDGQAHTLFRTLMNPLFSPKYIVAMEDGIRASAVELIEPLLEKRECEFQNAFGQSFPVRVFLQLMGLPLDMTDKFLEWEAGMLHGTTIDEIAAAARSITDYLRETIEERRKAPGGHKNDLLSFAISARVEGRPLTDGETLGICFLMFAAGLDTVASMLSFTFKYLAENPQQQQLLRQQPDLIPGAMEEIIRAFSPVNVWRRVMRDIDFHGVHMKKGDVVNMAIPMSARDEHEYPEPHTVDFDRENTRHITFGVGPHRCLGSHLARREIKIALEEWLKRIPEFRLADGKEPRVRAHGVWAVESLPIVW